MTPSGRTWMIFGACTVVILAALARISVTAFRLERYQLQAGQRAEIEDRLRLALWRMDSALAPLVAEESARPWTAYQPSGSVKRPGGGTGTQPKAPGSVPQTEQPEPSPLLGSSSSNILLHFQYGSDGRLTSPEAPEGDQRRLAELGYATLEQMAAASARQAGLARLLAAPAAGESDGHRILSSRAGKGSQTGTPLCNGEVIIQESGTPAPTLAVNTPAQIPVQSLEINRDFRLEEQVQKRRSQAEYVQRANVYQPANQQATINNLKAMTENAQAPTTLEAGVGVFKGVWLGDQLVLVRRVERPAGFVVQGVWLNWTNLRASLLASVTDLFPAASLGPVRQKKEGGESHLLAALPVRLEPGPVPSSPLPVWTPVRLTLLAAWVGVLVAALAVALLLHGAVSLSERRAAFVSAVTHELRTPLTTFKMYSEMLADDMVPEAARRRQYLETLTVEANRLSHLVENVLAYARLERGSARRREERITLGQLIERVKPRLVQRTEQAGMRLVEDADPPARETVVHVDVSAVEQILFNLVDNSCKYAAPQAAEKIIHLEALPGGKFAMLRVRDHGQGISAEAARRLFQPFSKSAHEAARSAPGVGLGLALCRRLSRSMGGDLRLAGTGAGGACFELLLPLGHGAA